MSETITCDNLDEAIEKYRLLGYRLDMIMPADAPRVAMVSKNGEALCLRAEPPALAGGPDLDLEAPSMPSAHADVSAWVEGRAGMEYRDLISDRMGGKMIASHIRLTTGGAVDDYVHFHKIEFQMICCIRGRIKVVYEDQGPPFWLEPGDWVIQPPQIRHRVLESEANSEVIEITMPAEHETWVDHEMRLPTNDYRPDRDFSGQRFVRFIAQKA